MRNFLLVDIGNSRVKWALKQADYLRVGEPIMRGDRKFRFEEAWNSIETPKRILVSNVLGDEVAQELAQWCLDHWSTSPEFVRPMAVGFGVENGYLNPARLGVDRWACLVAARAIFKDAVCVMDCGTAITVDILDPAGRHQGGVICPGVELMQDALFRGTYALSREGLAPAALLGRDTGAGIHSGTLTAAAGLIEKLLNEVEKVMQCRLRLLLCGGGAQAVGSRLRVSYTGVPDLVLQGLAVIASENDYEELN